MMVVWRLGCGRAGARALFFPSSFRGVFVSLATTTRRTHRSLLLPAAAPLPPPIAGDHTKFTTTKNVKAKTLGVLPCEEKTNPKEEGFIA
jgi:hypothetical protein